ncbi:hypothetical protein BKA69DRAFT_1035792 [Paraphysoderma sedebokerense]|nr:hypothetical protein BKA69DRAFT_1035792 [Paraphysoderma sedebokerense]
MQLEDMTSLPHGADAKQSFMPSRIYPPSTTHRTIDKLSKKKAQNDESQNFDVFSPSTHQSMPFSVIMPHGFQLIKSLLHWRPTLRSVLFVPFNNQVETFFSLDSQNVHVWKGQMRHKKIPVAGAEFTPKDSLSIVQGGNGLAGLVNINKWIYVKKLNVFIVSTSHLELKILDQNLVELSHTSSATPVLSLEYNDATDELIAGGVGSIRIWKIQKEPEPIRNYDIYSFHSLRLVIDDLKQEEWVTCTYLRQKQHKLYVACNTSLLIYDYISGKRLETLREIHELAVASIAVHPLLEYLITGGKDGSVKIWNSFNRLLYHIRDHRSAVTGIVVPCDQSKPSRSLADPFVMSCSLDGSIRLWNLETLTCIYQHETQQEILGMAMMKDDAFFHFSNTSPVARLKRFTHPTRQARIAAASEDGCIRFLSPVTGQVLLTAFPTIQNCCIIDLFYNFETEKLYVLMSTGDIAVYSTMVNPCKVLNVWTSNIGNSDKSSCVSVLDLCGNSIECVQKFWLIGGNSAGQIVSIDISDGRQEFISQAHSAPINAIHCDPQRMELVTCASDRTIKIWTITIHKIKQARQRDCISISLETVREIIVASLVISIPMHADSLASSIMCSPHSGIICVGTCSGNITVHDYKSEADAMKQHTPDDDHTMAVSQIAYLPKLRLFASGSLDGTVKIWNVDNTLVRELHLGEPVISLCFANERGNLLIGMSDQICLIRWEDYLPPVYLKRAYTLNYREDELESPIPFNPDEDIWGLSEFEGSALIRDPRIPSVEPSHIISPFVQEQVSFSRSKVGEKTTDSLDNITFELSHKQRNRFHGAELLKTFPQMEPSLLQPEVGPLNASSSQTEFKYQRIGYMDIEETSKLELRRKLAAELARYFKKGENNVKHRHLRDQTLNSTDIEVNHVDNEISTIEHKQAQFSLKHKKIRRFISSIGSLPNSSSQKRNWDLKQSTFVPTSRLENPTLQQFDKFGSGKFKVDHESVANNLEVLDDGMWVDEIIADVPATSESIDHVIHAVPPSRPVSASVAAEKIIKVKPAPTLDEKLTTKPKRMKSKRKRSKEKSVAKLSTLQRLPIPKQQDGNKAESTESKIDSRTSLSSRKTEPPKPLQLKSPQTKATIVLRLLPSIQKSRAIPKKTREASKSAIYPKPKENKPINYQPKPIQPSLDSSILNPHIDCPPKSNVDRAVTAMARMPDQISREEQTLMNQKVDDVVKRIAEGSMEVSELISPVNTTDAHTIGINQTATLTDILNMEWFPGMGDRHVTLRNVVQVLLECCKEATSQWTTKVEASNILLHLFQTYPEDLTDPFPRLIEPQLTLTSDKSWQVRAQICENLSRYGLHHLEILFALICRLSDDNEIVRSRAMDSLEFFGVNSRSSLKEAMLLLGMIVEDGTSSSDAAQTDRLPLRSLQT